MSDETIIQDFLDGKSQAVDLITDWIQAVVHIRPWTEAISPDDIVADSRAKLFINLQAKKFNGRAPLKIYVQRVAHFTVVDSLRAHKRQERMYEYLKLEYSHPDMPDSILQQKEHIAIVDRIYDEIDEKCRKLWNMLFHEGLSAKTIAQRDGLSESTIRVRAFRCKQEAMRILKRLTGDGNGT